MTSPNPVSLVAARHPAIRALASAISLVAVASLLGGGVALVAILGREIPVGEKVLYSLFIGGLALVAFLFAWYVSLLGRAVADLAEIDRTVSS